MTDGPASLPEIRLVDLSKHFREVRAVDSVSMEIHPGEFFSLLGPSGCGKTTTLRMIGGFELPTSGRIELRGRDVTLDPPDRRPVNMVFQSYALFPHLDVAGNIGFGLRRKRAGQAEIRRRVGEVLELVHLSGYERRKPNELSGGQQQRVALARALVNRPNVLLLDEPLGALDLKLRKRLQIELKRIQTEVGITFVYVTHDQEEALTMSDRIAVMNRGRVEQFGTPEALYERPATPFVADFIGTTNLLHGSVDAVNGREVLVRLASGECCRIQAAGRSIGDPVDLSLRPEAVRIEPGDATGDGNTGDGGSGNRAATIPGEVEQAAYLGAAIQYLVRTHGGMAMTVLAPKTRGRLGTGTAVVLSWSIADSLVLGDGADVVEEMQ